MIPDFTWNDCASDLSESEFQAGPSRRQALGYSGVGGVHRLELLSAKQLRNFVQQPEWRLPDGVSGLLFGKSLEDMDEGLVTPKMLPRSAHQAAPKMENGQKGFAEQERAMRAKVREW